MNPSSKREATASSTKWRRLPRAQRRRMKRRTRVLHPLSPKVSIRLAASAPVATPTAWRRPLAFFGISACVHFAAATLLSVVAPDPEPAPPRRGPVVVTRYVAPVPPATTAGPELPEPPAEPAPPTPAPRRKTRTPERPPKVSTPRAPSPDAAPPQASAPDAQPEPPRLGLKLESGVAGFGVATSETGGAVARPSGEPSSDVVAQALGSGPGFGAQRVSRAPGSGGGLERPRRVQQLEPEYPAELRAQGIEGDVTVRIRLSEDGSVVDARLVASSGYDAFDRAALETARRERFSPARDRGRPISFDLSYTYRFRLEDQ